MPPLSEEQLSNLALLIDSCINRNRAQGRKLVFLMLMIEEGGGSDLSYVSNCTDREAMSRLLQKVLDSLQEAPDRHEKIVKH